MTIAKFWISLFFTLCPFRSFNVYSVILNQYLRPLTGQSRPLSKQCSRPPSKTKQNSKSKRTSQNTENNQSLQVPANEISENNKSLQVLANENSEDNQSLQVLANQKRENNQSLQSSNEHNDYGGLKLQTSRPSTSKGSRPNSRHRKSYRQAAGYVQFMEIFL